MEKRPVEVKSLKEGGFVIIDDIPCKVVDLSISKPGKHGSAKAKLTAVGLFETTKKIIVKPGDAKIDVPVIEKKDGQVISISDKTVQVMDLTDFSLSDVDKSEEFDLKEGDEILIWKFGSRVMIKSKKS